MAINKIGVSPTNDFTFVTVNGCLWSGKTYWVQHIQMLSLNQNVLHIYIASITCVKTLSDWHHLTKCLT
jgi:hypothetical protein